MKTKKLFLLLSAVYNITLFAQTTKPTPKPTTTTKPTTTSKPATPAKSEIDRLAEKYKDASDITLYTSHGGLMGNVSIDYNDDEKPQSISISGKSYNIDIVAEFLSQIIAQKEQQGYKSSDGNGEMTDANWLKRLIEMGSDEVNYTFKKGNMYFIVKGKKETPKYIHNQEYDPMDMHKADPDFYSFSIETGDNSRKGGKKATKFDF